MYNVPAVNQSLDAVGAHKLCAVEQSQTLFALELDGTPAEDIEYFAAFEALAIVHCLAFAYKGEKEIGQGSQVARSAEGTTVVDYRQNVIIIEVEDTLYSLHLHAAESEGEGVGLEKQHQLDDGAVYRSTDGAGVALDQVFLKYAEFFGRDGAVAERAESGGNAVDRLIAFDSLAVQILAAVAYLLDCCLGEYELRAVTQYRLYQVVGQLGAAYGVCF